MKNGLQKEEEEEEEKTTGAGRHYLSEGTFANHLQGGEAARPELDALEPEKVRLFLAVVLALLLLPLVGASLSQNGPIILLLPGVTRTGRHRIEEEEEEEEEEGSERRKGKPRPLFERCLPNLLSRSWDSREDCS